MLYKKPRTLVLALLILLAYLPPAFAQPAAIQASKPTTKFNRSAFAITYKKFVLDNGLTLLVP